MAYFMVFFARCRAENNNTMRDKLVLSWYRSACATCVLEQSGSLWLNQHGNELLCAIRAG